jgi:hypothetical protein
MVSWHAKLFRRALGHETLAEKVEQFQRAPRLVPRSAIADPGLVHWPSHPGDCGESFSRRTPPDEPEHAASRLTQVNCNLWQVGALSPVQHNKDRSRGQ